MTKFMQEATRLSKQRDFIQSIMWACSTAGWSVAIEKETAEENGDFDKAVEAYKREMELRKIEKECAEILENLDTKSGE